MTNVNEPPQFAGDASATETVAENTADGENIGSPYTATDPENDTVTYSLGGTDAASFDIDTGTGQLKTKATLDFETKETYSVTIQVTDGKDAEGAAETPPVVDDTHDVAITVTDVDDAGTITFSSDTPAAGTTLTASLADDDGVKTTPAVTWAWENSTDQSNWTPITGADTDSITLGTEDIGNYYRVTATYDDEKGSGKTATGETTNAVVFAPPTNLDPEFASNAATTLSVPENTPAGQNIGDPYTATHGDSKGTLVYSLGGTDDASFDFDTSTGQLKTKTIFDYDTDTKTSYTVTISVSDGMDDYSNADTAEDGTIIVTINVTDVQLPDTPGQPTVTAANGAAAKLDVTWTAVEVTDAKPVAGYDVEYQVKDTDPPDWSTDNVTISGATATITGLGYNTTYEVQVRAKNIEGESDWSPTGEGEIPSSLSVSFSQASQTVTEGNTATITVNVSPAADRALSIPVSVSGTNTETGDYQVSGLSSGELSIASGDSTKTFTISTTADSDRNDETVNLSFGQLPAAVGTGTNPTAMLTIDDTTPRRTNTGGGGGGTSHTNQHPSFADARTTRSVSENTPADQNIGDPVAATHPDSVGTLVYSLDATGATNFAIDSSTGQLKTKTVFDFETDTTSYTVTVSVKDGMDNFSNPDTAEDDIITVTINVTDVNEGPKFADGAPGTQTVAENTAADTNIGSPYTATDPDSTGDTLTYSLGGTDAASFDIDTSSGQLKTKADLDFETKSSYSVTIQVTDGKAADGTTEGTATIDDTHAVTVTVADVDDPGSITLSSQTPTVNSALAASLSDQDGGVTGETWLWEISDDGQSNWTTISGETTSSYTPNSDDVGKYLRVSVDYTDAEGSDKSADAEAGNAVLSAPPTNKHPEFAEATAERSVAENTDAGQNIGAPVSATHGDSKGTLKYSLSGTDDTSFAIDTNTGQIKTKTVFDYETDAPSYTVTISVSDGMDDYSNTDSVVDDSITVTINVTNVNEDPTFADDAPTTLSVDENTATDTDITDGLFKADDPEGDTPIYSLAGPDAASFAIDTDGQLKTKADLDHETKSSYSVTIQVTDSKAADGTANPAIDATHTVTISVTDVDDDGAITLPADPPSAGTKLTARLTDDDGIKPTPAVTWKWESSPNGTSTWTEISGETTNSYTPGTDDVGDYLRVTATYADDHSQSQTAQKVSQAVLTAPATNLQPSFSDAWANRSVAENTDAGQNIGAPVAATHADSVGTLVYSLSGTDASSFDIVASTGQIKTKTMFDYETDTRSYTVTVSVTDGLDDYSTTDSAVDSTITVTINVTNVNEGPTFDSSNTATREVAENTDTDIAFGGAFTVTDPENDTPTYSLGGTNAASFDIDTTTGELKTKADLDHETKASYSVTIRVTDGKAPDGTANPAIDATHTVTITVTDADDPGTITFSADPPSVGTTLTATLNDDDTPISGETWSWEKSDDGQSGWTTITGADTSSFTPQQADIGKYLRVTVTYTDSYGSSKTATDDTGAVTSAPVTNQNPEFDSNASTDRSVAENMPAGQKIGDPVAATHSDRVGTLVYSLDGTDAASFDIDTSTGQLKTKTVFDYETDATSYTVTVSVTDGMDDYSNTDTVIDGTITVTINVTDVNEGPKFADDAPGTQTVAENTAADTNIGSPYTATDPENDTPLTYSLGGNRRRVVCHRRHDGPAQDQGRP